MEKQWVTIDDYCEAAHEIAVSKGWYDEPREFGTALALIHSEVSEALEAYRNFEGDHVIAEELADVCIRIFDLCGHMNLDLEAAINGKMQKNMNRPYKHGGKRI